MNFATNSVSPSARRIGSVLLLGVLATVVFTSACSRRGTQVMASSPAIMPGSRPAVVKTAAAPVGETAAAPAVKKTSETVKPSAAKVVVYRSRDYGLSFEYPWQYAFVPAKAIATGGDSLKPKPDGHDGQFTLARVDVPQGFYAGTDYDSGYFTISLNQDVSQEQCESAVGGADAKVQTELINGVEFRSVDSDTGGRGQATRLRQYVAFTNGTCYELELGVKTSNESGLAREVDPEQVMRRLNAMARTVKILAADKPASVVADTATPAPAGVPQN